MQCIGTIPAQYKVIDSQQRNILCVAVTVSVDKDHFLLLEFSGAFFFLIWPRKEGFFLFINQKFQFSIMCQALVGMKWWKVRIWCYNKYEQQIIFLAARQNEILWYVHKKIFKGFFKKWMVR